MLQSLPPSQALPCPLPLQHRPALCIITKSFVFLHFYSLGPAIVLLCLPFPLFLCPSLLVTLRTLFFSSRTDPSLISAFTLFHENTFVSPWNLIRVFVRFLGGRTSYCLLLYMQHRAHSRWSISVSFSTINVTIINCSVSREHISSSFQTYSLKFCVGVKIDSPHLNRPQFHLLR